MSALHLWVNGREVRLEVEADEMLADVLRGRLGLTGTKIGCGEAECGSCTVLIDGEPVLSCVLPAEKSAGRHVLTIEGLAATRGGGGLHPLQQAFITHGAVQCGYCTPGQIMTSVALLSKNPDPSEDEIRSALKDTLCRCGAYRQIISAVGAAAEGLRTGGPVAVPEAPIESKYTVVGRALPRADAEAKVTGEARFTDDLAFPEMLQGRALRAGVPHAKLTRLDVSRAREMEGVRAVVTAAEIPGARHHGLVVYDWPVLVGVGERVRYVGDAVALVAAETRRIAGEALALIQADFEELPPIADPRTALGSTAPSLHASGNLLEHIEVRKGQIKEGLAQADVVMEATYYTPSQEHAFLEPECSIARPLPNGGLEIYVGSQIPYADREQVARCLAMREEDVRVIGTLVGGGFGGKEDIAGQIHAALLARATGRPVKILYDRAESLQVHPKRHATEIRVRLGARRDGTLVAAETELFGDTGAYASLGDKVMARATTHSTGPYVVPHVTADCYATYTNNPPAGAFRGFGVTQSAFAVESAMDELAHELGIDPVRIRRQNALRAGEATNTGQVLHESVGLLECIDRVEAEMRRLSATPEPFRAWAPTEAPHLRRAWGFAVGFKNTGLGGGAPDKAGAEVELYPDGKAEVRTSSAELGQGLSTVLQMIAAEELGLPAQDVRVLLSDTDLTPDGGPTTASRQTFVTGNAVRRASLALREAVAATLAERLDQPPEAVRFVEGLAHVGDRKVPIGQVVRWMKAEGREPRARTEYWAPATQPLGSGGDIHFAFAFAAQAAEVEVDLETGEVRVLRVITANDVGRALNPLGLQGQIDGGVIMGLGTALTEEFIVEQGRIFTDRLARYRIPSVALLPEIRSFIVEHPAPEGPYGAKGVGEIVSIPTAAAITNAIYHACGVRVRRLPVDQDWLARTIAGGEAT